MMDEGADDLSEGNSLTKAVHQGRLRLTRLLLEGGAYINESNERGETPLMVACRSRHPDSQGANKARMVRYLLERKADPNIQDKAGRTALMHACREGAGPAVVRLLLDSGADLGLQDREGCSALVHAIHAEDGATLEVLLSACQARGTEVIIVTTATSPSGRHTTRRYLSAPAPARASSAEGAVRAVPPGPERTPGFAEEAWDPGPPSGSLALFPGGPRLARGRTPPALKHQPRVASLQEELLTAAEQGEPARGAPGYDRRFVTRHQSIDAQDAAPRPRAGEQADPRKASSTDSRPRAPLRERSLPGPEGLAEPDANLGQAPCASALTSVVQKREAGANHYSSDSGLAASEDCRAVPGRKEGLSPSPSLPSGSWDVPESVPHGPLGRRGPGVLERRGSGAFSREPSSAQARLGLLPPLHASPHPPGSDAGVSARLRGLLSCGQRALVPTVPDFPKDFQGKKTLLRRQSLQTEQIKQLVNF